MRIIVVIMLLYIPIFGCVSARIKPGADKVILSNKSPAANCIQIDYIKPPIHHCFAKEEQCKAALENTWKNNAFDMHANYVKMSDLPDNRYDVTFYRCP